MTELSSQAQKILDILSDRQWHCPIDWNWGDGHGKRITDIIRYLEPFNKTIENDWCDCGRHSARILKRRIVSVTPKFAPTAPQNSVVAQFLERWKTKPIKAENTLF